MTDPVILLGTQSNGETLPVQVDDFGRLVAEGLQGSEGPEGPQGPQGPQGPEGISYPPDPYEGALLGWLNGGPAWVGSPPVPIPPDVFGPIVSYDQQNGLIEVSGAIPESIGNGVYVFQCNADGSLYTEGWNVEDEWVNRMSGNERADYPFANLFDGDEQNGFVPAPGGAATFTPIQPLPFQSIDVWGYTDSSPGKLEINGVDVTPQIIAGTTPGTISKTPISGIPTPFTSMKNYSFGNALNVLQAGIEINNLLLVNRSLSLNMRVNSVLNNTLFGVPNQTLKQFTPGKYLSITSQRVAPWVLYGNDPTSRIDHLRSS
jgi:hypothetical protein